MSKKRRNSQGRLPELRRQMEELRREMLATSEIYGMTHPETLKASARVDAVHNEINRIVFGR